MYKKELTSHANNACRRQMKAPMPSGRDDGARTGVRRSHGDALDGGDSCRTAGVSHSSKRFDCSCGGLLGDYRHCERYIMMFEGAGRDCLIITR